MEKLLSKIKYSLNKSLLIQNIVFGFISIQFILLDKAFSFNPFIVALLFSSYFLSPGVFVFSSCISLITSAFISIKYFLELSFVQGIFLFCAYSSKLIKNNEEIRKKVMLISFISILIIFYFILDRTLYTLVMSSSLGVLSYVLSRGGENISSYLKDKEKVLKDEDLFIGFFLITSSLLPIKTAFIFYCYLLSIILKRCDIHIKKYLCLFLIFCAMYFFGNYTLDEAFKFILPLLVFFLINKKYFYLFMLIFTLFSYVFDNLFYLSSSYYIGVVSFLVSLLFNENMLGKIQRFIMQSEEKKIREYNNYTLQLVNILNSFDELLDLLRKDEFDKKEEKDDDYYMKKEHKRLFNKEISFFKEPLQKMMNLLNTKEETKVNKFRVKSYSFSSAFKDGENGDYNLFIEEKNIFSSLLVDGMGHNKTSKQIAKYVASLYLHMKYLSSSEREIITCLNAFIKGKTYEEIYSTFDLLKFDLVNGNYYSYQYGSYPTFLIRNREVVKISQIFPPVGIISILEVEPYIGQIEPNDIFVQLSDGFKENLDKEIERFFRFYSGQDDDMIIDYLFDYLSSHRTLEDDRTLIVLKIVRNDEKVSHL